MRERIPHADIDVAGTKIPQHASVIPVLAPGNRDPMRFHEPDRFEPTRPDNQHLGFGSGIHLCYGGPLARIEAYIALSALLPHLGSARLVEDPPPYRQNAMLRGPRPPPPVRPTVKPRRWQTAHRLHAAAGRGRRARSRASSAETPSMCRSVSAIFAAAWSLSASG